jgi:hypothetical protein
MLVYFTARDKPIMIRKWIANRLAGRKFITDLLEKPIDLSEFKERPTTRVIIGLILIGLSYVMGWPAVIAFSVLAAWLQEPMIAVIGCPTTYGLSYVVFIIGAWIARAPHYLGSLSRYALQWFLRKLLS